METKEISSATLTPSYASCHQSTNFISKIDWLLLLSSSHSLNYVAMSTST